MNKLCPTCPMNDERYYPSNQQEKQQISNLKIQVAALTDFIEYLFDHSEHCDHITYNDAWKEFEEWQEQPQNKQPNE